MTILRKTKAKRTKAPIKAAESAKAAKAVKKKKAPTKVRRAPAKKKIDDVRRPLGQRVAPKKAASENAAPSNGNGISQEPIDVVKRLTELERLRFFENDTLLRNNAQAEKILQQEEHIDATAFNARQQARKQRTAELKAEAGTLRVGSKLMLVELGGKYDFNPQRTAIDDKTGVIQEQKPDQ